MVRDEHDRHAALPAEACDGGDDLVAAARVEHGRGLVKDDDLRAHGDDARDRDALLLPAGEQVRGMGAVFVHADLLQGLVDTLADLRARHAEVFRGEGHVVLNHVGDKLVVRVLENHADAAADLKNLVLLAAVDAVDDDAAGIGREDRVHMLGERGFAAAVVAENGDEAALVDLKIYPAEAFEFVPGIGEMHLFKADDAHIGFVPSYRFCGRGKPLPYWGIILFGAPTACRAAGQDEPGVGDRQTELAAVGAAAVFSGKDALRHIAQNRGREPGGIRIDDNEQRIVRQYARAERDEGPEILFKLPDLAARPASVGRRVHDDRVVTAAAADLPLDKFGAVVHDPADRGVAQAGGGGIILAGIFFTSE